VETVFEEAFRLDTKGVTIYRDGSRDGQVLSVGTGKTSTAAAEEGEDKIEPRKRPDVTFGRTEKIKTGCGNLYVTLNHDEAGLCEVFTQMGKSGGCAASQSEAIARLISLSLRAGVNPSAITKNLRGIRCPHPSWEKGGMVLSCPDGLGVVLERYLNWREGKPEGETIPSSHGLSALDKLAGACPECGGTLEHEEGCMLCRTCGFSRCG
jgi:ribonucleoside-diphosphate reductase alpha chain